MTDQEIEQAPTEMLLARREELLRDTEGAWHLSAEAEEVEAIDEELLSAHHTAPRASLRLA